MTIDASIPLQVRMPNLSDIYNEAEDRRWQREQRGMQRTQFTQQQEAQAKAAQNAEIGKRVELVGQAAQWADNPQKWDQAIDYLTQQGLDVAQYKGKFTPELRMSAISGAGQMKEHYERTGDFTLGPGAKRFDATGKLIAEADFAPRPITVKEGETVVEYAPGQSAFKGGFDQFHSGFLAGAEGGYNPKDPMSGAPVNFGIDQRANPDIDVKKLTPDQAKQIMLNRYWKPSGADQIQDPALQAVHADTAVNMGVGASRKLLAQSGNDPEKYLQLREARYREIGGPVLDGWMKRNDKLRQFVGLGGGRVIAQGPPKAPKPQWQKMTPEEVQKEGLPPGTYQRSPDGEIKPIGGGKDGGKGSPQEQARGASLALEAAGVKGGVDPVSELIKKSTSGGLQTFAANAWSNMTGDSTDGMEAIGRLRTIGNDMVLQASGGSLGAQISNSDRDFMAARFGDIGNPELSADMRLAAWDQVKKRLTTLAGSAPANAPAAGKDQGKKRLRYNPATGNLE